MKSIKFLGTAGARFVVARQLRASGGIWLKWEDTNVLIDPGPGTLVKCASSRPTLDPSRLQAIILTHRHLDHCSDINVMIEAMTEGGFKKRATVFCPQDALKEDPVILKYLRNYVSEIEILKEKGRYKAGEITFETPLKHIHGVETYGLNFKQGNRTTLSLLADTRYFEGLSKIYPGRILVINVVLFKERPGLDHLCLSDAERIIKEAKPEVTILTHFGMTMLKAKPYKLAKELEEKLKLKVMSAYDGMEFKIG